MQNRIELIGRLGDDPEVRIFESGTTLATFSVATSKNYKDKNDEWQEQTEWHSVKAWGYLAERIKEHNYIRKGELVFVEGEMTYEKWEDDEGNKRTSAKVRAYRIKRLSERGESKPGEPKVRENTGAAEVETLGSDEVGGDDLPF